MNSKVDRFPWFDIMGASNGRGRLRCLATCEQVLGPGDRWISFDYTSFDRSLSAPDLFEALHG
jgi:hypothetical protein